MDTQLHTANISDMISNSPSAKQFEIMVWYDNIAFYDAIPTHQTWWLTEAKWSCRCNCRTIVCWMV